MHKESSNYTKPDNIQHTIPRFNSFELKNWIPHSRRNAKEFPYPVYSLLDLNPLFLSGQLEWMRIITVYQTSIPSPWCPTCTASLASRILISVVVHLFGQVPLHLSNSDRCLGASSTMDIVNKESPPSCKLAIFSK